MRLYGWLAGRRLALLAALAALVGLASFSASSDWGFFSWGSRLLFGQHERFIWEDGSSGGLHLYAHHPILQVGPPSLLLARLLVITPGDGAYAAAALIMLLGYVAVICLDRTFMGVNEGQRLRLLIGGAAVIGVWGSIEHFGHLDDALALACVAAACLAVRRQSAVVAGLLLGLAAASKPWAVVLLPMVLALAGRRRRATAMLASLAVVGLCWLPFVLADTRTFYVGNESIEFHQASPLAALGFQASHHPAVIRLVQFALGAAACAAAVLRGRWYVAPLAAFAVRLAIDPLAYPYYVVGPLLGAALLDLAAWRRPLLVATPVVLVGWIAAQSLPLPWNARADLASLLAGVAICGYVAVRGGPASTVSRG